MATADRDDLVERTAVSERPGAAVSEAGTLPPACPGLPSEPSSGTARMSHRIAVRQRCHHARGGLPRAYLVSGRVADFAIAETSLIHADCSRLTVLGVAGSFGVEPYEVGVAAVSVDAFDVLC